MVFICRSKASSGVSSSSALGAARPDDTLGALLRTTAKAAHAPHTAASTARPRDALSPLIRGDPTHEHLRSRDTAMPSNVVRRRGAGASGDGSGKRRLAAAWVGVGSVLALAVGHCLAGIAVYGSRRGALLQVGSLQLSSASPVLVQQAEEQSSQHAVFPRENSLEEEGEAMLAGMQATNRLKRQVAAVKDVEAQWASKPQPHESLDQMLRPPPSGQQPTMLLQVGAGDGVSALGVGVPGFQHFEDAGRGRGDDYYQAKFRYGGNKIQQQLRTMEQDAEQAAAQQAETAEEDKMHSMRQRGPAAVRAAVGARAGKRQSLLEPNAYPKVGYPFDQQTIDSAYSNGPAQTFDSPPQVTCPSFIPNCKPQHNTLKECDFSCGAYCQAIRGDGPCLSGDAEGEGRDCKFGYRGASLTPSLADEEESGWLEKPSMWAKGGPKDCMTCPVGFKIKPLYGDGTGPCMPCAEGWVDSDTGLITEAGCAGGQYVKLTPGEEPGQALPSDDYSVVAGCTPTPEVPVTGAQILAKVPADLKDSSFFENYAGDYYPAQVSCAPPAAPPAARPLGLGPVPPGALCVCVRRAGQRVRHASVCDAAAVPQILGQDADEDKLAIKFADGGPFVGLDPGIDATALGDEFVALPKVAASRRPRQPCRLRACSLPPAASPVAS